MSVPVIYRADLEAELRGLEKQRQDKALELQQIEGAARMCRHLIGKIEQRGTKEDAEKVPDAPTNQQTGEAG